MCGLDLPAVLLPHLSARTQQATTISMYTSYLRPHGLAGTWMDACPVQYVACGRAVIMYWLAET